MSEHCVCCGEVIPEGRQVCPICEEQAKKRHIPLDKFDDEEDEDYGAERD